MMSDSAIEEPRWKLIQRVIAFLEKSITPDAEVLHDQRLPDITTGHPRQCDVVIKYGTHPRQSVAIVEVQDRTSKVEIGTLGGWWDKRNAVGAEKLICVSALDYPQSVKDAVAKKYGPAVSLLRLRELEEGEWPFATGFGSMLFAVPNVTTVPDEPIGVLYGPGPLGPGSAVPPEQITLYRENSSQPITINDLVIEHFDRRGPLGLGKGTHRFRVRIDDGTRLYAEYQGVRQEIRRLEIPVEINVHVVDLPLTTASYEQVNVNESIAWVTFATGVVDGENVQFKMSFVPDNNGRFTVGVSISGAPRGGFLGWPLT